jgi:hypothetical protein
MTATLRRPGNAIHSFRDDQLCLLEAGAAYIDAHQALEHVAVKFGIAAKRKLAADPRYREIEHWSAPWSWTI